MNTPLPRVRHKSTPRDNPRKAVGYIRLSTEKQALDDTQFEKQAEKIRKLCARRGIELLTIHEDTWSGADPFGAFRRDGLLAAVKDAHEQGAILIVPEVTRLFRNLKASEDFIRSLDVQVFSAKHKRVLSTKTILREIIAGENTVQNIRKGTCEALAKRKAEGVEFSTATVRHKAAKSSANARTDKAQRIVHEIAAVIHSDPAYRDLTHEAFADLLNRRGLRTGWNRPWTWAAVRRARKQAEALIQDQADADAWVSDLPALSTNDSPPEQQHEQEAPLASEVDVDDGESEMRKHPTFGMF